MRSRVCHLRRLWEFPSRGASEGWGARCFVPTLFEFAKGPSHPHRHLSPATDCRVVSTFISLSGGCRRRQRPGSPHTSDGVRPALLRASSSPTLQLPPGLGSPSLTPQLRKGPLGLLPCPGNPVDTGARQTTVHAVGKSQTRLSTQRTRKYGHSLPLPPPVSSRKTVQSRLPSMVRVGLAHPHPPGAPSFSSPAPSPEMMNLRFRSTPRPTATLRFQKYNSDRVIICFQKPSVLHVFT